MFERDLLVAIIAFALGAFVMHAALVSRPSCFEFWLVKRIDSKFGRRKTRAIVGFAGLAIVMLGVYVLAFPSSTQSSSKNLRANWFQTFFTTPKKISLEHE